MIAAQNAPSVDRQQRRIATAFAAGLAFVALPSFEVEAASCRGHPQSVRVAIKKQIEALRGLERELQEPKRARARGAPVMITSTVGLIKYWPPSNSMRISRRYLHRGDKSARW